MSNHHLHPVPAVVEAVEAVEAVEVVEIDVVDPGWDATEIEAAAAEARRREAWESLADQVNRATRRLDADPRAVATLFDRVAAERQVGLIGRDESLELVAEHFAALGEEMRAAVAAWSSSVLHLVEVFAHDRSPVVRAACARNFNNGDVRLQQQLVRDTDPFVVLALVESANLDIDVVEFLLTEYPFDVARYRLATKPLATAYLERLAADPSPAVAAAATTSLEARRERNALAAAARAARSLPAVA